MRVLHRKETMPVTWMGNVEGADTAALEFSVKFASLRLKVLVFNNRKDLRRFWNTTPCLKCGGTIGRRTLGVVSSLSNDWRRFRKDGSERPAVMEVDKRYFAVMALCRGYLGMEVICHESVHAAYAYAKRTGVRNPWAGAEYGIDEERVCYPAGRIARHIVKALNDGGMYKDGKINTGPA